MGMTEPSRALKTSQKTELDSAPPDQPSHPQLDLILGNLAAIPCFLVAALALHYVNLQVPLPYLVCHLSCLEYGAVPWRLTGNTGRSLPRRTVLHVP